MRDYFRKNLYRIMLLSSAFILLSFELVLTAGSSLSLIPQRLGLVIAACFILYTFVYIQSDEEPAKRERLVMKACFVAIVACTVASFYFPAQIRSLLLGGFVNVAQEAGIYITLITPLLFLVLFGSFLYAKRMRKVAYLLFAMAVIVVGVYFFSGLIFNHYRIDDEVFIAFEDIAMLLHGANPYSTSVAGALYHNVTAGIIAAPTITTTNQIVGTLNYPSLYLFAFLPFYFAGPPTLQSLINTDLQTQASVYLLLLLFTIAAVVDKKFLEKPNYGMLIFLALSLAYVSAITNFLMLALLILAYVKLRSRYAWVLLGLCASIQELLWFPIVMLLLYSVNNYGARKGLLDAAGAVGVFLLINSYFIVINPAAFIKGIFTPLGAPLMSNGASIFGYMITSSYQILLGDFRYLFALSMLFVALAFLYFNNKRLVGLFSIIPFLVFSHSIPVYYTFFIAFIIITLLVKKEQLRKKPLLTSYLRRHSLGFFACLAVIIAAGAAVIYASHSAYLREFNLSVSNTDIFFNSTLNATVYDSTLHYHGLANYTVSYIVLGAAPHITGYLGLMNQSIINGSVGSCSTEQCTINLNILHLNPDNESYMIRAYLRPADKNDRIFIASSVLYNGDYFYVSNAIYNASIPSAP
ncbi:MAG: hypothetical protein KGH52_01780 [Candidatus Micrarchaeota archaeon]|nr:hypothetical protein [Candidatus Micrarchaeota archaeon]